jgi:pantoate--beta-alanine ligase
VEVIRTVAALRARLGVERRVALVPTMGNLHAGHLSLVALARQPGACVVATIFVNRLQFEPGGDFDRYPRTFDNDCRLLEAAGCDVLFAPDEAEMYPQPQEIRVTPPKSAEPLCGRFRPGHFEGVVTVVAKLFNIVRPQVAVFGSKDYQQLNVIRALERQLAYGITIVGAPTIREADGLALSSRNGYLSAAERAEAPRLQASLRAIAKAIGEGNRDYPALCAKAVQDLERAGWRVDYVEVRNRDTLEAAGAKDREVVVLAAAWLGRTRLIDNLEA